MLRDDQSHPDFLSTRANIMRACAWWVGAYQLTTKTTDLINQDMLTRINQGMVEHVSLKCLSTSLDPSLGTPTLTLV